jgi:hypothetical protein
MEIVPLPNTKNGQFPGLRPVRPPLAHAFYCRVKAPTKTHSRRFIRSKAQPNVQGSKQKNRVEYLERHPRRAWLSESGRADRIKRPRIDKLKRLKNRLGRVRKNAGFSVHSDPEGIAIDLGEAVFQHAVQLVHRNWPGRRRIMRKTDGKSSQDEKKQHSQDS